MTQSVLSGVLAYGESPPVSPRLMETLLTSSEFGGLSRQHLAAVAADERRNYKRARKDPGALHKQFPCHHLWWQKHNIAVSPVTERCVVPAEANLPPASLRG